MGPSAIRFESSNNTREDMSRVRRCRSRVLAAAALAYAAPWNLAFPSTTDRPVSDVDSMQLSTTQLQNFGEREFERALIRKGLIEGDFAAVTLALERLHAVTLFPEDVVRWAIALEAMGNYEQALTMGEKAIAQGVSSDYRAQCEALVSRSKAALSGRRKRPVFDPAAIAARSGPGPLASSSFMASATNETMSEPKSSLSAQQEPSIASLVEMARDLISDARYSQAYELLDKNENLGAGAEEFDYLLGTAAVEVGKSERATLALERVLALNPDHHGARLELGRAYWALGNLRQAKAELRVVLAANPPSEAKEVATRYLSKIENGNVGQQIKTEAYVEVSLGHDSNVNTSTSNHEIETPTLGAVTLADDSVEKGDSFGSVGVGGIVYAKASEMIRVFAGLDARGRQHFQESQFDLANVDYRAGFVRVGERQELRLTAFGGRTYLSGSRNRDNIGLGVDWQFALSESSRLLGLAQFTRVRHPEEALRFADTNQTIISAGWLERFPGNRQRSLFAAFTAGYEQEENDSPSGNGCFTGLRLAGQTGFWNGSLFGSFRTFFTNYDKEQLVFQTKRRDQRMDATIGMIFPLPDEWTVRPQLVVTHRDSNISIYEFDRLEGSVALRKDF